MNPDVVGSGTNPINSVHPVLILGIIMFVVPFFSGIGGISIPKWISSVGIFVILAGAALSIMTEMANR